MTHLSPRTKSRVHQINVFKKATGRSRRMVTAELMKKAEPPPPPRKKTPPKGPAVKYENGYSLAPAYRPLKRTREEDHVFGCSGFSESPTRRSVIEKNGLVPASPAGEREYIKPAQSVVAPDSVCELHHRTSPAKEDLPRRSPIRLASIIERPTATSTEESPPSCRGLPNGYGYSKALETDVQTDQCSGQSQMIEECRMVDSSVACGNGSVPSPPRAQFDQVCFTSPSAIGFENLLRRVGSPETVCPADACSLRPPVEENGDSELVKLRPGLPNLQRRVAAPEYVAAPSYFHGLWNLGNTCYMNVVIQLLWNLDSFAKDVGQASEKLTLPEDGIFLALAQVFQDMILAGEQVVNPLVLQSACETYMTDFCGSVQQDAQEYLLNILDKIEEEITPNQEKLWEGSRAGTMDGKSMCPTTRNFRCQVRNILSCEGCDNIINVEQSSRHFSLPLPEDRRDPQAEVPDIEALLNIYFQVETLSRKCEKCGAETMKSETKIVQLPRVMVLHINRFEIDRHMLCSKVSVPVKFADSLDLRKWCLDKVRGPCDAEGFIVNGGQDVARDVQDLADCRENSHVNGDRPVDPEEGQNSDMELDEMYCSKSNGWVPPVSTCYRLHGVVSHVGKLASCGHYTVDIFDSDSSKYVRCDDAVVREVASEDVFCEEKSAEAYVLLYVLRQN